MRNPVRNMGASVRARLLNILLLTRYALERLLYRLSITNHRERFVLKGAMLMTTWLGDPFRPTRFGNSVSSERTHVPGTDRRQQKEHSAYHQWWQGAFWIMAVMKLSILSFMSAA
jgi:hypothetical protein